MAIWHALLVWNAMVTVTVFCVSTVPDFLLFKADIFPDHSRHKFLLRLKKIQSKAADLGKQMAALSRKSDLKVDHESEIFLLFKEFSRHFDRQYLGNREEFMYRYKVFKGSLLRQHKLNANESIKNGTALYGINMFSDWTQEEFFAYVNATSSPRQQYNSSKFKAIFNGRKKKLADDPDDPCVPTQKPYPNKFDWREKGVITPVRNQGSCGSCWAFVAAEQVESYWKLAGHNLTEFSAQEFVSCVRKGGCNGGNTCKALTWLATPDKLSKKKRFLLPEAEYPYEDKSGKCAYDKKRKIGAQIGGLCGCQSLVGHEDVMLHIIHQKGPLGINVDAVLWHDYIEGIIQHHCTNKNMNHAVQIVGYNLEGNVPYWVVKNQWGISFGELGYVRVKYGENMCGVAEEPSFLHI